jgi:hypothetical protein
MTDTTSDILRGLRSRIGERAPLNAARDEVNQFMIRRWCDVMGETNPAYTDPVWAERSVFGGVVAPPAMMDVFDKPGLLFRRDVDNPQGAALAGLESIGCTSTVAVNSELEYDRYLRLGDLVHSTIELEDISDEKRTGLGTGHFVTSRYRYFAGDDQVGSVLFRVLKFRPGTGRSAEPGGPAVAATPATSIETPTSTHTRPVGQVHEGDQLPAVAIPITTTLVVAGALMTLDYFDGHHDRDMAIQRGSSDVFMNIHTSAGLVERFISDWAGPAAIWRNLRLRLGAPNYPGDTMTLTGSVAALDRSLGTVVVSFAGKNSAGVHAQGSAELALPGGSAYPVA